MTVSKNSMSNARMRENNFDFDALEMVNVAVGELVPHSSQQETVTTLARVALLPDDGAVRAVPAVAEVAADEVVVDALVTVPYTENNDEAVHDAPAPLTGDVRNLGASSVKRLPQTTSLPVEN